MKTRIYKSNNRKNFTIINNEILRRDDVSWKAKGIMAYIMALPEDWEIYLEELQRHATDGRDSFRSGWKELIDKGYVRRYPVKDKGKITEWRTEVRETIDATTFSPLTGNPQVGKPQMEKPQVENPKLLNTYSTNNLSIQSTNNTKSRNSAKAKYDDDSPYLKLSHRLFDHIKQRNPEHKQPNFQTWADDIRKTVELDNRNIDNLTNVLDWSQQNDFWQSNILSAKKLREKYDTLTMQMLKDKPKVISHNFAQEAPKNDSEYQYTQEEIEEYEKATGIKWEG